MNKTQKKRLNDLQRVNFKLGCNSAEIYDWVDEKYEMNANASRLAALTYCHPKKIKKFVKKAVQTIISI